MTFGLSFPILRHYILLPWHTQTIWYQTLIEMACNNLHGGNKGCFVWTLHCTSYDGGHLIDPATRIIGIFSTRKLAIERMREEQEEIDEVLRKHKQHRAGEKQKFYDENRETFEEEKRRIEEIKRGMEECGMFDEEAERQFEEATRRLQNPREKTPANHWMDEVRGDVTTSEKAPYYSSDAFTVKRERIITNNRQKSAKKLTLT